MPPLLKTYKYSFSLLFSITIAIVLYFTGVLDSILDFSQRFAYPSAFIAGFFSSVSITAATASLYFVELGEHLNVFAVVILGALGAMSADLLMYRFIKKSILVEFKMLFDSLVAPHHRERMETVTKHRVFLWTIPFLASILIASPLPNELGITLFSLINFRPKYLSIITFCLNAVGIFLLVLIGHTVGAN